MDSEVCNRHLRFSLPNALLFSGMANSFWWELLFAPMLTMFLYKPCLSGPAWLTPKWATDPSWAEFWIWDLRMWASQMMEPESASRLWSCWQPYFLPWGRSLSAGRRPVPVTPELQLFLSFSWLTFLSIVLNVSLFPFDHNNSNWVYVTWNQQSWVS